MQKTGKNRDTIDKFYTKKEIVSLCIGELQKIEPITKDDFVIEPSAGSGNFLDELRHLSSSVIGYDIEPHHKDVISQDYLKTEFSKTERSENFKKIFVIGNPPFGRQSCLAKQFIRHSCNFCDVIGFILPKSFKKDSFQKVFPLSFHLLSSIELPVFSFLLNDISYDVPCVFQIWKREKFNREIKEQESASFYSFVKKSQNPHLSIRRVGVYAGKIDKEIETKSEQSHYFIRFDSEDYMDKIMTLYQSKIIFDCNNTVGPKSISKPELIEKLNSLWKYIIN